MSQDDFAFEPIRGLPERPPEGEVILWQGQPNWLRLTVESLNVWWILGYFIFLFVWRFISVSDLMPLNQAVLVSLPFLALAMIVTLLLMLVGYIQAKATVYTITNKRVVMRIGAALTVTLNLPFTEIENAAIASSSKNFGSIAIDTKQDAKFSFLVLCTSPGAGVSKPGRVTGSLIREGQHDARECIPGALFANGGPP